MNERENNNRKKRRRKLGGGIKTLITIISILAVLGAAGAIYWAVEVKPPEAGEDDLGATVITSSDLNGGADINDGQSGADPDDMESIIEEQAQQLDLSGYDQKDGYFTLLVAGTDAYGEMTDTIIVATFNINDKSVSILNIPRDTLSRNIGGKTRKINAAYLVGGIDQMKKEIKNLIGFEINKYVIVNFSAFERIVDEVGGITVNVPEDMYKNTGDMIIDLDKGEQTLDGEHALMLMRYRGYANADLERISVQQEVYKAVIKQLAKPSMILKLPQLTSVVAQNVVTDLTVGEMIWIGVNYATMNTDDVVTNTLPNKPKYIDDISYVIPIKDDILELVNQYYNPYTRDITSLNLAVVPDNAVDPR